MTDIVTLKAICDELKIDPREARERLRAAAGDAKANPELAKAIASAWLPLAFDENGPSSGNVDAINAVDRKYKRR